MSKVKQRKVSYYTCGRMDAVSNKPKRKDIPKRFQREYEMGYHSGMKTKNKVMVTDYGDDWD